MLINDIDITTYKAQLLNRQIATAPVKSNTDWLDAVAAGILLNQKHDYRQLQLTFLVTAESEDEAYKLISKLTHNITKCNIKFDDISYVFPCLLDSALVPERLQNSVFKVVYILKNDWALGDAQTVEFEVTSKPATAYTVQYYRNWSTVGAYTECYDTEIEGPIAEETLWIADNTEIETVEDWTHYFLALGLDLNKYQEPNELNGFVDVGDAEFSMDAAAAFVRDNKVFKVYYNRFSKDGYADFPIENYPTKTWMTLGDNKYYVDLGVGKGWNPADVNFYVYGRYYAFASPGNNGSMMGTYTSEQHGGYSFALQDSDAVIIFDDHQVGAQNWEVYQTDTIKGGHFIIETLESISATPMRKYGFMGDYGEGVQSTSTAFIFNGVTLDRVVGASEPFEANFRVMSGAYGPALYCEVGRVIVEYKGETVLDLVPIDGSVANGFFNNYDSGLYDMVNMKFYPWTDGANTGSHPEELMPIPSGKPGPTPPKPIVKYTLTVNGGTIVSPEGNEFREGTEITIKANAASKNKEFDKWTLENGSIVADLTKAEITFNMPASDVTITSTYKDIAKAIYFYNECADGNAIKAADDAAGGINKGATQIYCSKPVSGEYSSSSAEYPMAYDSNICFVYSIQGPYGEPTQWNVGRSKSTFLNSFTMTKQGSTPDGRAYIVFDSKNGRGTTGPAFTIDFETETGELLASLTFDQRSF